MPESKSTKPKIYVLFATFLLYQPLREQFEDKKG